MVSVVRNVGGGFSLRWYGGHGIHIYYGRKEVGIVNVGDFSKESLTPGEASMWVDKLIESGEWREVVDWELVNNVDR